MKFRFWWELSNRKRLHFNEFHSFILKQSSGTLRRKFQKFMRKVTRSDTYTKRKRNKQGKEQR